MTGEKVVLSLEFQRILERNGLAFAKDFGNFDLINLILIGYIEKLIAYKGKLVHLGPQLLYSFIINASNSFPRPLSHVLNLLDEISSTNPLRADSFQKYTANPQFSSEISALSYFIPSLEYLSDTLNVEICLISKEKGCEIINCSNFCSQIRISLLKYNQKHLICYTKKDEPIFPNIVSNDLPNLKAEYLMNLISNLQKIGIKYNLIKSEDIKSLENQDKTEKYHETERKDEIERQDETEKYDENERKYEMERQDEEEKQDVTEREDENQKEVVEKRPPSPLLVEEQYELKGIPIELFKVLYRKDDKPVRISFLDVKSIEKLIESGQAYLSHTCNSILPIPDLTLTQQTIKDPIPQNDSDEEDIIPNIEKMKSVFHEKDLKSAMNFN